MNKFKKVEFEEALQDSQKLSVWLQKYLRICIPQQMQQSIYCLMGELHRILNEKVDPKMKVNAMYVILKLIQTCEYVVLMLIEVYILPLLLKVIEFKIKNQTYHQMAQYFDKHGYTPTINHLPKLSFNYVSLACEIVYMAAIIKPKKMFYQAECQTNSNFHKIINVKQTKHQIQLIFNEVNLYESAKVKRLLFLEKLKDFPKSKQLYINFFMSLLQKNLQKTGTKDEKEEINFKQIFHYGDVYLTSEAIAIISQIMCYNNDFRIRKNALLLLNEFILWGDIEALLVVNYTEYVQILAKQICPKENHSNFIASQRFSPEKIEFYKQFLKCLHSWAQSFPNDSCFNFNSDQHEPTPLNQIYHILKQKKVIFPKNSQITLFEKQAHKNLIENMERNKLILQEIYAEEQKQSQFQSQFSNESLNYLKINDYVNSHISKLQFFLRKNDKENVHQIMKDLLKFHDNFERYLQDLEGQSIADNDLNQLIEQGLELKSKIEDILDEYKLYLQKQIVLDQFIQRVARIFKEKHKSSDISDDILLKKNQINFGEIKSNMSFNFELKTINSKKNMKALNLKYRHRINKLSNKKSSEGSNVSLDLFSRKTILSNSCSQNYHEEQSQNILFMEFSSFNLSSPRQNRVEMHPKQNKVEMHPNQQNMRLKCKNNKKKICVVSSPKNSKQAKEKYHLSFIQENCLKKLSEIQSNQANVNQKFSNKTNNQDNFIYFSSKIASDNKSLWEKQNGNIFEKYTKLKDSTNCVESSNNFTTNQEKLKGNYQKKSDQLTRTMSLNKQEFEHNSQKQKRGIFLTSSMKIQKIKTNEIGSIQVPRQLKYKEYEHYYNFLKKTNQKQSILTKFERLYDSKQVKIEKTLKKQRNKCQIQIIIQIKQLSVNVAYEIKNQSSISLKIKEQKAFPNDFSQNKIIKLIINGQMNKQPLLLPIITFYHSNAIICKFELPFAFNNIFQGKLIQNTSKQINLIKKRALSKEAWKSQTIKYNKQLFRNYIFNELENILKALNQENRIIYFWRAEYKEMRFTFVIDVNEFSQTLSVTGFSEDQIKQDDLFVQYGVNFLAHLFACEDQLDG